MYSILHSFGFFLVLFLGNSLSQFKFNIFMKMSGAFLPWRLTVAIPMFLAVPIFIGIFFLHESPDWLRKNQRLEEMEKAARFYRRYDVKLLNSVVY